MFIISKKHHSLFAWNIKFFDGTQFWIHPNNNADHVQLMRWELKTASYADTVAADVVAATIVVIADAVVVAIFHYRLTQHPQRCIPLYYCCCCCCYFCRWFNWMAGWMDGLHWVYMGESVLRLYVYFPFAVGTCDFDCVNACSVYGVE